MDFITFLQNTNSNILSAILNLLNLVLFVQLTVACCRGIRRGWTIGEATAGKIALLTAIAAIMFRLWQSWPQEWLSFAVLPQCAFVVFAGGLVGCTFKWGVDRAFLRN
jgi:hypothetical protein